MGGWFVPAVLVLLVGSLGFLGVLWVTRRVGAKSKASRGIDIQLVRLTEQLRRNPSDAVAYTKRGIVRSRKGDLKGAVLFEPPAQKVELGS